LLCLGEGPNGNRPRHNRRQRAGRAGRIHFLRDRSRCEQHQWEAVHQIVHYTTGIAGLLIAPRDAKLTVDTGGEVLAALQAYIADEGAGKPDTTAPGGHAILVRAGRRITLAGGMARGIMHDSREDMAMTSIARAQPFRWALAVALLAGAASATRGQQAAGGDVTGPKTLYVDPRIAPRSSTTYDPGARKCGKGKGIAYRTIAGAGSAATAGQTVLIRGGTYAEPLAPKNSGLRGRPITFRNFPGEKVVITGPSMTPAVNISGRRHIVIEGLRIENVRRWLYALGAHHNTIRGNQFLKALSVGGSSKTGLFFQEATFNRIVDNVIEDSTQDNLSLVRSDHNVVEGNTFRKAKHTLWTIKGGSFNIIRNNHFHNAWQKIGEVLDCDRVGFDHQFTMSNCTKRNLVEGNVFAYTASSGRRSPYAGIQYAGQDGIIRRNVFHSTVGPALSLTLYGGEATFNTGNRVCHNVFYGTDFAGLSLSGATQYAFEDNRLANNILAESIFVANDTRWSWYTRQLAGKPVQVMLGRTKGFHFRSNNFFASKGDGRYLIAHGSRNRSPNPAPKSPAAWQQQHPELFAGNLQVDPRFQDAAKRDFRLQPGSRMIDAGAFLTKTRSAGGGTALPVEDVAWFFDGFDIPGQHGDVIQLAGGRQVARVVDIDYERKVLQLGRALKWSAGQGVTLRYAGRGPDIGVAEHIPGGGGPPYADFTARVDARQPLQVRFDAGVETWPLGQEVTCQWSFGDGKVLRDAPASVMHTYRREGDYTVTLVAVIKGKSQFKHTATRRVQVGRPRLAVGAEALAMAPGSYAGRLAVSNTGTGTLVYTVTSSTAALIVRPSSGTCVAGPVTLAVSADAEAMPPGMHAHWVLIDAGSAGQVRIPVRVRVAKRTDVTPIKVGDTWRYFTGKAPPPPRWNTLGFNDAKWPRGVTGIGYSSDIKLPTKLSDMMGNYTCFYARRAFNVADPSVVTNLRLGMVYDDGFVAYLNGVEVARSPTMGASGSPVTHSTIATGSHDEEAPETWFPIQLRPGLLRKGTNVLALRVHNVYIKSSDCAAIPRLHATLTEKATTK